MSSNDSESSGSGRRHGHKRANAEKSLVLDYRLKHCLCHKCGTKLFNAGRDGELVPCSLPGIVVNGRCLFCYPLATAPNAHLNAGNVNLAQQQTSTQRASHVRERVAINEDSSNKSESKSQGQLKRPYRTSSGDSNDCSSDESETKETKDHKKRPKNHAAGGPCRGDDSAFDKLLTTSIRDADGLDYVGKIEQGNEKKGRGVFTHLHEEGENAGKISVYEGEFLNGMVHGKGVSKDASGCVYEGQFVRGAAHGRGKCQWAEQGWRYEGQWANDNRHGQGTCSQMEEDGEVYTGSWKDNEWDGKGTLRFAEGGQYVGEFKTGRLHGKGTYTFADGSVYTGYFKKDLREGHGEMVYANDGAKFVGRWQNNWRNGKGTLIFADGSVWKGSFRGDDQNGVGYLHLPGGIVRKQRYVNGRLQRGGD